MPTFSLQATICDTFTIEVEATDEDEAIEKARALGIGAWDLQNQEDLNRVSIETRLKKE